MRLSFFRTSRVSDIAELPNALASREYIWAFVDEDDRWFRPGEAIRIRRKNSSDRGGVTPSGLDDALVVDELLSQNARFHLDAASLRPVLRMNDPRAFRAALHILRPISRAWTQLDATTSQAALEVQRELHDATEVVDEASESEGLSDLEEVLVERWMRANGDVLDVGCGAGREALALAHRGMRVVAVDVSERSVDAARARAAREFATDRVSVLAGELSTIEFPDESFDTVFFASDVFACIPGRETRRRVLRRAAALARPGGRILLQAMIAPHRVRAALLDGACAAFARLTGAPFERGDRLVWRGPPPVRVFRHGFATDEEVVSELESAGLSFTARCGSYVVAEKSARVEAPSSPRRSLLHEARAVLGALPRVDRIRKEYGPKPAATTLRSDAATEPCRDARGRARLARAIELCDRIYPFGRGGCYRRALLEIALDSGAATEPLYLGLADPEGHAWLPRCWPADRYPAVFTV